MLPFLLQQPAGILPLQIKKSRHKYLVAAFTLKNVFMNYIAL